MHEGSRPTPKHVGRVHEWLVYRREVTRTPFRVPAAEIGIPRSTVEKLYEEKLRPSKVWARLRDWYMRDRHNPRADCRTPPGDTVMSAVRVLDDFPAAERGARLRQLVELCPKMYEDRDPRPEWIRIPAALAEERTGAGDSREERGWRH